MRSKFVVLSLVLLSCLPGFAQNWKFGETFTRDGITFKVVGYCLVTDSRDTVSNASTFYDYGELLVTNVSDALTDVVIPVAIGRYQVIGLTDSLFYGKTYNRIWLPELEFIGNSSFENAKIKSGTLVLHNVKQVGEKAFFNIDARLCFDISKPIAFYKPKKNKKDTTNNTVEYTQKELQPKGGVVCHTKSIGNLASSPYFGYEIAGQNRFFKKCVSEAYGGDKDWIERTLATKFTELRYCKKNFSTTPSGVKKGFDVRAVISNNIRNFPWGHLTAEYGKQSYYNVYNKKKRKDLRFDTFRPVADKSKDGWHLQLSDGAGEVKFTLNGKRIKK